MTVTDTQPHAVYEEGFRRAVERDITARAQRIIAQ